MDEKKENFKITYKDNEGVKYFNTMSEVIEYIKSKKEKYKKGNL